MIEVNSALVCASIPALKPLFKPCRLLKNAKNGHNRRSGYEYHGTDRSGQKSGNSQSGHSHSGSTASDLLPPHARTVTVNDRTVSTGTESTEIYGMGNIAGHDQV